MRMWAFSSRTAREILRDPLTLFFGLGFPLILLCLLAYGNTGERTGKPV